MAPIVDKAGQCKKEKSVFSTRVNEYRTCRHAPFVGSRDVIRRRAAHPARAAELVTAPLCRTDEPIAKGRCTGRIPVIARIAIHLAHRRLRFFAS
jgi:hypothetical protein